MYLFGPCLRAAFFFFTTTITVFECNIEKGRHNNFIKLKKVIENWEILSRGFGKQLLAILKLFITIIQKTLSHCNTRIIATSEMYTERKKSSTDYAKTIKSSKVARKDTHKHGHKSCFLVCYILFRRWKFNVAQTHVIYDTLIIKVTRLENGKLIQKDATRGRRGSSVNVNKLRDGESTRRTPK